MTRVLFIARHFPPLGGAGVQRSVKFVKYLPEFGILPIVVTGAGDGSEWWSPSDRSLLSEIPAEVRVYRTATASLSEGPAADSERHRQALVRLGEQAAHENHVNGIFVSMSPFGDASVAAALSKRLGVPWVADLRDPWALDEFRVYPTALHRMLETWKMRWALRTASVVVMNTPEAAVRYRALERTHRQQVVAITNGYDADDFYATPPAARNERFTIVHSGYLHTTAGLHQKSHAMQYRLLGRVERGVELLARSHVYLLMAVERWMSEHPEIGHRIVVKLVGRASTADLAEVPTAVASMVEFTGYLSHANSVAQIRAADLLFLPMHKIGKRSRATIVPGKTYEYLAAGKPVLASVPAGDARDYVASSGMGVSCDPGDVDAMVQILKRQYEVWAAGGAASRATGAAVSQFERRAIARRLADVLREAYRPSPSKKRGWSINATRQKTSDTRDWPKR